MSDDYRRTEARLLQHHICDLQREIDQRNLMIDEHVTKILEMALLSRGETEVEDYELGSHECLSSPVGLCVYYDLEDSMHDDCIFCNQPEERK